VTAYLTLACCIAMTVLDSKITTPKTDSHKRLRNRWKFALDSAVMAFSDQQIVTGISIVIGGYSQLQWGLASYHWESVVNLAWFSTMAHLLTLTVLRGSLRDKNSLRLLRILAMGLLVAMLIPAIVPVGWLTSSVSFSQALPAWCLYQKPSNTPDLTDVPFNGIYVGLAIVILIYSYSTRVILLYSKDDSYGISRLFRDQPYILCESQLQKYEDMERHQRTLLQEMAYRLLRALCVLFLAITDVYQSSIWEVYCGLHLFDMDSNDILQFTWLSMALAWGTIRIFVSRKFGDEYIQQAIAEQNVWGFGQVIAVVLLALPFISFYGMHLPPSGF
jgi:hypothetical protein